MDTNLNVRNKEIHYMVAVGPLCGPNAYETALHQVVLHTAAYEEKTVEYAEPLW